MLSLGMVAGAGAIAWYGMAPGGDVARSAPAPLVTLAATPTTEAETGRSAPVVDGTLPTRVVVAAAGIDAAITEVGVVDGPAPTWETAWRSAGHHLDSALPGQPGNVVITGHVSVADRNNIAVFRQLDRVSVGDVVELYSGTDLFRYQVTETRVVDPDATTVLRSDHRSTVTLVTCTHDLKRRLVVTGTLLS